MSDIIKQAQELTDYLTTIRREFHMYPEISQEEEKTGERISAYLKEMGYEVTDKVAGHGVMADLVGKHTGPTIALRADTDALSITESNDVIYRSRNNGVMHACGHDNHIAILLGAAKILKEQKANLHGTVRFIFQPAEELSPVGGSRAMIKAGALKGVDAIFGLHVWPDLPHGVSGVKKGNLMAASDHFSVTINGKSCHAAKPNDGVDAVVVGSYFVQAIQSIISRQVSPLDSAVLTIGKFNAGTRYNIIAGSCELEGTCRTFNSEVRNRIEKQLQTTLDNVCSMFGATGKLNYERGYAALNNDPAMTDHIQSSIEKLFGKESVVQIEKPSTAGEDFSFYLLEKPGSFIWLGTAKEGLDYPLHNQKFDIDEDILWRGVSIFAQTALDFAETFNSKK